MEFERILDYRIEEITAKHGLIIDETIIKGIKVREFIKKEQSYYSYNGISDRYLNEILRILDKYNLRLNMTDLELKIYETNPDSVFITTTLNDIFTPSIITILNRRGINNLSELVSFSEKELAKSNYKGSVVTMAPNTLNTIKEALTKLGLSLGMKEDKIITFGTNNEVKTKKRFFWQK